jgi:hypothetical protein
MPDILGMDLSFLHNTGVGDVEIPVKDKKRLFYQDEGKFAPPPLILSSQGTTHRHEADRTIPEWS